jgi:hypothetical protein
MNPAEIIVRDVQRDRGNTVVQLLLKAVRQSRKSALAHAERKVLLFNVTHWNVLILVTAYYFTRYCYYGGWRVSALLP